MEDKIAVLKTEHFWYILCWKFVMLLNVPDALGIKFKITKLSFLLHFL